MKREKLAADAVDTSRYPFSIPCVRLLDRVRFHQDVTFVVGENGTGKSTLLEVIAIACRMNPEGGSKNFNFATRSSHSELHRYLRIARSTTLARDGFFLRAESYYNLASELDRLDEEQELLEGEPIRPAYGNTSLHAQSHGESFFALLQSRLRGNGLYILDEPEAAVSPMRQLAMLQRIHELVRLQSQFIIATHSPILMAYPLAKILVLGNNGFQEVQYEETEHYKTTRSFLLNSREELEDLLRE